MKEISNTLFSKEIPKDVMELFEGKSQVVDELIRKEVAGENSAWFKNTGASQSCAYIVRECNEEITEGIWTRCLQSGSGAITINLLLHIQSQNHLVC